VAQEYYPSKHTSCPQPALKRLNQDLLFSSLRFRVEFASLSSKSERSDNWYNVDGEAAQSLLTGDGSGGILIVRVCCQVIVSLRWDEFKIHIAPGPDATKQANHVTCILKKNIYIYMIKVRY
jgi:hypothetical protein